MVQLADGPAEVISLDVLDRMTEVIRHRGPDDVGTHVAPGIAIGVRRLSIVDVVDGHQPFPNEDGSVWAAQNGELYEHERLRDELRSDGHSFTSQRLNSPPNGSGHRISGWLRSVSKPAR